MQEMFQNIYGGHSGVYLDEGKGRGGTSLLMPSQ